MCEFDSFLSFLISIFFLLFGLSLSKGLIEWSFCINIFLISDIFVFFLTKENVRLTLRPNFASSFAKATADMKASSGKQA